MDQMAGISLCKSPFTFCELDTTQSSRSHHYLESPESSRYDNSENVAILDLGIIFSIITLETLKPSRSRTSSSPSLPPARTFTSLDLINILFTSYSNINVITPLQHHKLSYIFDNTTSPTTIPTPQELKASRLSQHSTAKPLSTRIHIPTDFAFCHIFVAGLLTCTWPPSKSPFILYSFHSDPDGQVFLTVRV